MSMIVLNHKCCGRLSAVGLALWTALGFVIPAVADSAADAVMFRKPKPASPPAQSFLLDVVPVKETKTPESAPAPVAKPAPAPAPAPVVTPAPAPKPAPVVTPAPAVETTAVASPAPKEEKPTPPKVTEPAEKPVVPKTVDAPKVEKPETPAPAVAPVVPVEKKAAETVQPAEKKADDTSKTAEKKADEGAKGDEKKDAKKKKKKKDDVPARDALITADRTDYDRKEGVVLFDRNVHVDDAQYQMHADRLFLFLEGTNDLKRLVAIGHVAITNEDKRAYCARATFNKKLGRVVMYSSDEITAELREEGKKGSDVKGEKITFWLDSEQVEVENPVITMPGGLGGQGNMKKLIGK